MGGVEWEEVFFLVGGGMEGGGGGGRGVVSVLCAFSWNSAAVVIHFDPIFLWCAFRITFRTAVLIKKQQQQQQQKTPTGPHFTLNAGYCYQEDEDDNENDNCR